MDEGIAHILDECLDESMSVVLESRIPIKDPKERFKSWYNVLGDPSADWIQLEDDIQNVSLDLFNQRIIRGDSERTRADHPLFREEAVDLLERILTYYLKTQNFSYKQGLNEVLAPFLLFHLEGECGLAEAYQCFSQFCEEVLVELLRHDGLPVLQTLCCAFKFLLRYHLPAIAARLETHGIVPELYTMPWFVTSFAAKNDIKNSVYPLWDFVILQNHPDVWSLFAGLALLEANWGFTKTVDNSLLPQLLNELKIPVKNWQIDRLWEKALEFCDETPISFYELMDSITDCDSPITLGHFSKDNVLFVDPEELCKYTSTLIIEQLENPTGLVTANTFVTFIGNTSPQILFNDKAPSVMEALKIPYVRQAMLKLRGISEDMWHQPHLMILAENFEAGRRIYDYLWFECHLPKVSMVQTAGQWCPSVGLLVPQNECFTFDYREGDKLPPYQHFNGTIAGVTKAVSLRSCLYGKEMGLVFRGVMFAPIQSRSKSLLVLYPAGLAIIDVRSSFLDDLPSFPESMENLEDYYDEKACITFWVGLDQVYKITSKNGGSALTLYLDEDRLAFAFIFDTKIGSQVFTTRFQEMYYRQCAPAQSPPSSGFSLLWKGLMG